MDGKPLMEWEKKIQRRQPGPLSTIVRSRSLLQQLTFCPFSPSAEVEAFLVSGRPVRQHSWQSLNVLQQGTQQPQQLEGGSSCQVLVSSGLPKVLGAHC